MDAPSDAPLLVDVSQDGMKVLLSCVLPIEGLDSFKDSVRDKIQQKSVCEEANRIDLDAILDQASESDRTVKDLVIYRGEPVTQPENGYIEWGRDYFKEGFKADADTGAIDFRRIAAELNVHEGELLATLVPPVEGKPGRDVFGKAIKPKKGKSANLRAGIGVKQLELGKFFATCSGRIKFNGKMVIVDNVYVVPGDIGLKTGHVEHSGALIVHGDILEGSEVSSDGDIEVHGIIEAATVRAGGDLFVHGGIVGGEGTQIRAGGSITARYILEADIEALSDITVEKEIVHSTVVARGDIHLPFGRILGGETRALREIVAGCTGTDAGVRTALILGEDPLKKRAAQAHQAELEELREGEEKIVEAISPFSDTHTDFPPHRKEIFQALLRRLRTIKEDVEELEEKIQTIENDRIPPDEMKVTVNQQIFQDSAFTFRKETFTVPRPVQGPIKVVYRKGKIKLIAIK